MIATIPLMESCAARAAASHAVSDTGATGHPGFSVTNHHWGDVNVYLVYAGSRSLLGRVNGGSRVILYPPERLIGRNVRIQLRPRGFDPLVFTSDEFYLGTLGRASVHVGNEIPQSYVSITLR